MLSVRQKRRTSEPKRKNHCSVDIPQRGLSREGGRHITDEHTIMRHMF